MSRGLSARQRRVLDALVAAKRSLDVTEELLPALGETPTHSSRRSLLRAVRSLRDRGLVRLVSVPSDRGGYPRVLASVVPAEGTHSGGARETDEGTLSEKELREADLRRRGRGSATTRRRLHAIARRRSAARRGGDVNGLEAERARVEAWWRFWTMSHNVAKVTGYLECIEVEDAKLEEYGVDILVDLLDDLERLGVWRDRIAAATTGQLGEAGLRRKIAALRAKTVARGATAEEEELARAMAERLERTLTMRLAEAPAA